MQTRLAKTPIDNCFNILYDSIIVRQKSSDRQSGSIILNKLPMIINFKEDRFYGTFCKYRDTHANA